MEKIAIISMAAMTNIAMDINELENIFINQEIDHSRNLKNLFSLDLEKIKLPNNKINDYNIQQLQTIVNINKLFYYAGLKPTKNVSLYIGADTNGIHSSHLINNSVERIKWRVSEDINFIHSLVSYVFGFNGESIGVQTACSSSLTTVHLACRSLQNHDSDLSIAGGISIKNSEGLNDFKVPGMIYSPKGECKPFDDTADGMVEGDGLGFILLKRYDDAIRDGNEILATINSTAINSDGNNKLNFSATSEQGQIDLFERLFKNQSISPNEVSFLEAHGTGTQLGDLIELNSITNYFTEYKNKLTISSSKSQLGHCIHAAGVLGVIKCVSQFRNNIIYGHPTFKAINSNYFNNSDLTLSIPNKNEKLENGVSVVCSYGMGGMNSSLLLTKGDQSHLKYDNDLNLLYVFVGRKTTTLIKYVSKMKEIIIKYPEDTLIYISKWLLNNSYCQGVQVSFQASKKEDLLEEIDKFIHQPYFNKIQQHEIEFEKEKLSHIVKGSIYIPVVEEECTYLQEMETAAETTTEIAKPNFSKKANYESDLIDNIGVVFEEITGIERVEVNTKSFDNLQIDSMELLEMAASWIDMNRDKYFISDENEIFLIFNTSEDINELVTRMEEYLKNEK
jgi:3-oxoacyl-(acyl-carrier-protein) synthase